jgi:isochorismate hydrolase
MRCKVAYTCSCGEFKREYEIEMEGDAISEREALSHRQAVQHAALGVGHVVTMTAALVGHKPPFDEAKWRNQEAYRDRGPRS